jgi:hypothetical protein
MRPRPHQPAGKVPGKSSTTGRQSPSSPEDRALGQKRQRRSSCQQGTARVASQHRKQMHQVRAQLDRAHKIQPGCAEHLPASSTSCLGGSTCRDCIGFRRLRTAWKRRCCRSSRPGTATRGKRVRGVVLVHRKGRRVWTSNQGSIRHRTAVLGFQARGEVTHRERRSRASEAVRARRARPGARSGRQAGR